MEIIKSAAGHNYIYDRNTSYISLSSNYSPKENENQVNPRFAKKLDYVTRHGIISQEKSENNQYRLLTKKDIDDAIINTHQIILEVTDKCNLDCYYCGYGHFYDNYDARLNRDLPLDSFKTLYNYLKNLWETSYNKGCSYLRISFYGGEPLCNFQFIHDAVMYTRNNPILNKKIVFSMTTNAVLLDKYMDFLVENNFEILISLDGDKFNDSYRTFKNGTGSFDTVISNIDKLQSTYPIFFNKNIKFNSVLHNRNSVRESNHFIYSRYNKRPMTNELNVFGIAKCKRAEFLKIFHSKTSEFNSMSNEEKQVYERQSPHIIQCEKWLFSTLMKTYSVNIFDALSDNFIESLDSNRQEIPTKTCIPFSRKIFVSVNGGIFPCERIGNEFNFGNISGNELYINYDNIIERYNQLFLKYITACKTCKAKDFCSVCVVSDINGYEVCNRAKPRNIEEIISFFEANPEEIREIIKNISII